MHYSEGQIGRVFALRLEHGEQMPEVLEEFAAEQGVQAGLAIMVGGADDGSKLVVGPEEATYGRELVCEDVNWISFAPPLPESIEAAIKIRYSAQAAEAVIYPRGERGALVRLRDPQRAITPGQAAVFYQGDEVIGGGTIAGLKT